MQNISMYYIPPQILSANMQDSDLACIYKYMKKWSV